jgi:hypothetical protein
LARWLESDFVCDRRRQGLVLFVRNGQGFLARLTVCVCHLFLALLDRLLDNGTVVVATRLQQRVDHIGHASREALDAFAVVQTAALAMREIRFGEWIVQNRGPRGQPESAFEPVMSGWVEYSKKLWDEFAILRRSGLSRVDRITAIWNKKGFKTGSGGLWTPRLVKIAKVLFEVSAIARSGQLISITDLAASKLSRLRESGSPAGHPRMAWKQNGNPSADYCVEPIRIRFAPLASSSNSGRIAATSLISAFFYCAVALPH